MGSERPVVMLAETNPICLYLSSQHKGFLRSAFECEERRAENLSVLYERSCSLCSYQAALLNDGKSFRPTERGALRA